MVSLDKIYTRGGDEGKTSLGSGERVAKHDLRVAAYGTSDEANAVIGIARLHTDGKADDMLARIQNDLFDLGADLCTPKSAARALGAHLHLARTVVRRCERLLTELAAREPLNPECVKYVNRLSDHLFQLSRKVNADGELDVLWVPGKNR